MRTARSILFVPADRPERFEKAAAAGADGVILDLEDAVPFERKDPARDAVIAWPGSRRCILRINPFGTQWFSRDLEMAARADIRTIMVPKADPESLAAVHAVLGGEVGLIALVETVDGYMRLREVCRQAGVVRLAFGNLDFGMDSGLDDGALDGVRVQIALESRFAGLVPPIDGVCAALKDEDAIGREARLAKGRGYGGKLCIHPAQVAPVNAAFLPSDADLAWARRILDAVAQGGAGAIAVDGKMVDRPVVERARAITAAGGQK
ncbi:HpcH/HpaI aldolase/citrate lyase family protein [Azorhizobium doebereinerae]|uniref:HpcH/HpaI aldolase/citrate lyase family protein n=1 Tax=Azorhizobium doebereinerae TaxID=281091 RepID=UPI0004259392|nr:CoA ester lyase [Azorhizobium doebereinerae]